MSSIKELHQEANKLRKENKFAEALAIYDKVWPETGDQYDGAGLLSCLRKLKQYKRAIPLADDLIKRFPDFEWLKNEVIWTYVSGWLNNLKENSSLDNVIEVANEIMSLNPSDLARKMTVFKVLKAAKSSGNWECVSNWTDKLSPDSLSTEPMTDGRGREGWCDQSLWYNYKAKSLIEIDKPEEVLLFIDDTIEKYPKQKKFFFRLKAQALYNLGRLNESEECYKSLCASRGVDWWLLHEYAKVVRDRGDHDQALKLMYGAAASNRKLELMVSLFKEIGFLCMEIDKNEVARAHLVLTSLIREEQEWSVSDVISRAILELNSQIGNNNAVKTIKEALAFCRKEWESVLGVRTEKKSSQSRKHRKGMRGKILLGNPERPFCFIQGDNRESFFCFKSDLPKGVNDKETVSFNAIPSFDKKKNKESWRAADISKIN